MKHYRKFHLVLEKKKNEQRISGQFSFQMLLKYILEIHYKFTTEAVSLVPAHGGTYS